MTDEYESFDRYYLTVCPKCGAFVKRLPIKSAQAKPIDMYCGFCELIFRASEQDGILFKRRLSPGRLKKRVADIRREEREKALNTHNAL